MKTGVFFYLRPFHSATDAGYQHRSIALAEGLRSLGVPVFANIDYWKLDPDSGGTLFKAHPKIKPEDCDIVVTEHVYFDAEHRLPSVYSSSKRRCKTVFIDASDGWRTVAMPLYGNGIDLVLRCHHNPRFELGKNVLPWAFGLTERILSAIPTAGNHKKRAKTLLCNYRGSHAVRALADRRFVPLLSDVMAIDRTIDDSPPSARYDFMMWEQSGRRHHPAYYQRLSSSLACSAFGGYFVPAFSRSLDSLPQRIAHKILSSLRVPTRTIAQFDSWRFWESLAAGCVAFHIDLKKYGCGLPVMPRNGIHYIGVDLAEPGLAVSRIVDGTYNLEKIAQNGKQWVIDHYSPTPVAKRFLQLLGAG